MDGNQDDGGHGDHQHVGGEIEQMQRQKDVDAVGFRADAGHQVAGALAAEVFEGEPQQVFVGGGAQVAADALGHQSQDVVRPAQAPGQQGGAGEAAERVTRPTSMGLLFWNGMSTLSMSGMVR